MGIPSGMHVAACAIRQLAGFEEFELGGALEVALLPRQDVRVTSPPQCRRQPANFEVGADGYQ